MPLDLQTLSTDTLLYMLMHSGIFVAALGLIFFVIGLLFGHATWGRYKVQTRSQAAEIDAQREEIATLKRKLGEQTIKQGGAAFMVTEVIPTLPTPLETPVPPPAAHTGSGATPPNVKLQKSKNVIKLKGEEEKTAPPPVTTETPAPIAAEAAPTPSPLAAIIAPQPPAPKSDAAAPVAPKNVATEFSAADLGILPDALLPEVPPTAPPVIKPELDPKLGLVFKTPPPQRDDLTALKGIAKVLEQRLHEFGIYTYLQIATWSEDHVKEFSTRLAFKDRIQREKWIEQAQRLHQEKNGTAA